VTTVLWNKFGPATVTVLADGALTLAMLWESAWAKGDGDTRFTQAQLRAIDRTKLQALYEDDENVFVPSLDLDAIGDVLK
jgi:hypothetical protein